MSTLMQRALISLLAVTIAAAAAPSIAEAQSHEVRLKLAWVRQYANRATIEATMDVHHAHKKPNVIDADGDDGDMHFSGTASEVGLPFVAEIVNAGMSGQQPADQTLQQDVTTPQPLQVRGAWRLWFEHPAGCRRRVPTTPSSPTT